jgi:outer membrane immunogenic protein
LKRFNHFDSVPRFGVKWLDVHLGETRSKDCKGISMITASLGHKVLVAANAFMMSLGFLAGCSALAADLPLKAPAAAAPFVAGDKWSGAYVGLIAGGAEGRTFAASSVDCPPGGFICDPVHYPQYGALIGATASGSKSAIAFTGGASAGFNWRLSQFAVGVEADVSSLHLGLTRGGSGASLNLGLVNNPGAVPVTFNVGATAAVNWLATFRARVGYVISPDLLVYATGGLALTTLSVSNSYTDNWNANGGGVGNSSVASNAAGYAVGGGAEYGLARSWTLKAEYLRVDFGSITTPGTIFVVQVPSAKNPFSSSANLTANLFRAGLNYHF